jgi:hypothetical protein
MNGYRGDAKKALNAPKKVFLNADDADQARITRIEQVKFFFLLHPRRMLFHPRNPRSELSIVR